MQQQYNNKLFFLNTINEESASVWYIYLIIFIITKDVFFPGVAVSKKEPV